MPLIAVDPGHGGRDLGVRHFNENGHMDLYESEVNLALALRVAHRLRRIGYRVLLTRDGDYALNAEGLDVNGDGEVNYIDEAQARVDLINENHADLLLSIHQNGFYLPDGSQDRETGGTVTFYCADRPFSADSFRFASLVQEEIVTTLTSLGYDVQDRGVMDDIVLKEEGEPGEHLILLGPKGKRIVRPCMVPGVLSETLFITCDREAALLQQDLVLDALANAYVTAVEAYFASDGN